ncbi:MAG: D-alanine--D-alanine ligase A, partial [Eubacterium sp.]|nr:D-alanine--D-alanine ligase A [Eubacterium sp.]
VFNEINTLPGFTSISMYPMLWEARGVKKEELIQKLIDLAMTRFES